MVKQRVDRLCQTDDRNQSADTCGDQNTHVKMADPIHKGGVKPQRHQQRGKAHSGRDQTQGQTEPAEQIPEEIGGNFNGGHLQSDQDRENHDHADDQGNPGTLAAALLARLTKQGGEHSHDQAHKQAD